MIFPRIRSGQSKRARLIAHDLASIYECLQGDCLGILDHLAGQDDHLDSRCGLSARLGVVLTLHLLPQPLHTAQITTYIEPIPCKPLVDQ